MLTKSTTVLPLVTLTDERAGYAIQGAAAVVIRRATYDEMGAPECVTLTVEPGDQLNPVV